MWRKCDRKSSRAWWEMVGKMAGSVVHGKKKKKKNIESIASPVTRATPGPVIWDDNEDQLLWLHQVPGRALLVLDISLRPPITPPRPKC